MLPLLTSVRQDTDWVSSNVVIQQVGHEKIQGTGKDRGGLIHEEEEFGEGEDVAVRPSVQGLHGVDTGNMFRKSYLMVWMLDIISACGGRVEEDQ